MLVDSLRGGAKNAPLFILLEDCHWLDPLSHDLLEVIGRAIFDLPVLLIVDYRPSDAVKGDQIRVSDLPHFSKFRLSQFSDQEAEQFVQFKLEQYTGSDGQVPASVVENITRRSEGNPFYIEELVNYLKDRGVNPNDEHALLGLELPTSLHSLVLTRIDERTERQKTTIKVASVIGRTFAAEWVWSAFPQLNDEGQVRSDLDELSRLDLTPLDTPEPDLTYIFKHAITHEAAYESLPFASRSDLHGQLGGFIESCCLDEIDQNIHLLAYHYEKSANENKKRHYLLKAGKIAQANYANQSAISYYKRVLDLLTPEEKMQVMLKLCDVYILTGDWPTADHQINQVLAAAKKFNDRAALAWGQTKKAELLGKQGQYFEASIWIKRAMAAFDETGDQEGAGQVRHNAGTQAAQQGDFKKAKDLYQQSLAIRTELGDDKNIANLLNNLGVVARSQGDQQLAAELGKNALSIRRSIGDKWAIAISLNNMGNIALDQGDYVNARSQLEEAVALQKEIGDRFYIANGLNNLGNVAREEGNPSQAWDLYRESMEINRDLGAQWSIAFLLEDMENLAAQSGKPKTALRLLGAASSLRKSINARLSEVEQAKVDRVISGARHSLNESQASSAWSQGTGMSLDTAVEFALSLNPNALEQT
jgi:predicted ATPase